MSDEQIYSIPLDSRLELTNEEMLVNAEDPSFHFNDQVTEGGLMANSFKYEGKGYIAGHYKYDFEDSIEGDVSTNWPEGNVGKSGDIWLLDTPSGVITMFTNNLISDVTLGSIEGLERFNDYYILSATTSRGHQFTVKIDAYNYKVLEHTLGSNYHVNVVQVSINTLQLLVNRKMRQQDYIDYYKPSITTTLNLRLQGVRDNKFIFDKGSMTFSDNGITSLDIPGLEMVNQSDNTITVKETNSADTKGVSDLKALPWYVDNPTVRKTYNNEEDEGKETYKFKSRVTNKQLGEPIIKLDIDKYIDVDCRNIEACAGAIIPGIDLDITKWSSTPNNNEYLNDKDIQIKFMQQLIANLQSELNNTPITNFIEYTVIYMQLEASKKQLADLQSSNNIITIGHFLDKPYAFTEYKGGVGFLHNNNNYRSSYDIVHKGHSKHGSTTSGTWFVNNLLIIVDSTVPTINDIFIAGELRLRFDTDEHFYIKKVSDRKYSIWFKDDIHDELVIDVIIDSSIYRKVLTVNFNKYGYDESIQYYYTGFYDIDNNNIVSIGLYYEQEVERWFTNGGFATEYLMLESDLQRVTYSLNSISSEHSISVPLYKSIIQQDNADDNITYDNYQLFSLTCTGILAHDARIKDVSIDTTASTTHTNHIIKNVSSIESIKYTDQYIAFNLIGVMRGNYGCGVKILYKCDSLLKGEWDIEDAGFIFNKPQPMFDLSGYIDYFVNYVAWSINSSNNCTILSEVSTQGIVYTETLEFTRTNVFNVARNIEFNNTLLKLFIGNYSIDSNIGIIKDYDEDNKYTQTGIITLAGKTTHLIKFTIDYTKLKSDNWFSYSCDTIDVDIKPKYNRQKLTLKITIRNNELYEITYNKIRVEGNGIASGIIVSSIDYDVNGQIVKGIIPGAGEFKLHNGFTNTSYSSPYVQQAGQALRYYLQYIDSMQAVFGMRGMLVNPQRRFEYIGFDNNRYIFRYKDIEYYVQIDNNAATMLMVHIDDVIKNRKRVSIPIPDAEQSKLLEEVMRYDDTKESSELIKDKDDNNHAFYILPNDYILEISNSMVHLYHNNQIVASKMTLELFNFPGRLLRWGVSCALSDRPYIWAITVDTDATSMFKVYYTKVRDDLNYVNWNKWVKRFEKSNTPSTTNLTYFCTNLTAIQVISSAVLSSTSVNDKFILGIKYQRGIHQWTIKDGIVITGFGSVGINGLLTGGWIPNICCGVTGFNAPVRDMPINIHSDACYNNNGIIMYHIRNIIGYTYAIDSNGQLLQHDLRSGIIYTTVDGENKTLSEITSFNMTLPVGDMFKIAIETIINLPGSLLYAIILNKLPRALRPNPPSKVRLPQEIADMFNIELPTGQAMFTGARAYLGYFHSASTWLTGLKGSQQIWNPHKMKQAKAKIRDNALIDLILSLSEIGVKAIKDNIQVPGKDKVTVTPGREARMTQAQANQIKDRLGRGKAGSHSAADIERYAHEAGVTDPSIISAIQQGSWNKDNSNTTWRQGIDSLVDEGTPATITHTPASASETAGIAATPTAKADKSARLMSTLGNLIDDYYSPLMISASVSAELNCTDDIIPATMDNQYVYSGPGYYSLQLVHVNRRLMDYQMVANWTAAGGALSPIGFISHLGIEILGTGIQKLPELPLSIVKDFGSNNRTLNKQEDMSWLGGQHLYLTGPLKRTANVSFEEPINTLVISKVEETWPPHDNYDYEKWEWSIAKRKVDLKANGGIIIGNSTGIDTDGFARTSAPVFTAPMMHDALLDTEFDLYCTAVGDSVVHLSVGDTKVIDGSFTNVIKDKGALYVASSYNVIKVSHMITADKLRPKNLLQGLAINKTGLNWIEHIKLMHAFDGYGGRIREWKGIGGSDIEELNTVSQYLPFKEHRALHSMFPSSAIMGKFLTVPTIDYNHDVNIVTKDVESVQTGTAVDTRLTRISIPIFFKRVADYPAGIQTIGTYKLFIVDGTTSLTTDSRTGFSRSIRNVKDIMIYGKIYRAFDEYLSQSIQQYGILAFRDAALKLGQKVLGADTRNILLFSRITRQLYLFTDNETLEKQNTAYRVKDFDKAIYEFLRQELIADADLINKKQSKGALRFDALKAKGMITDPQLHIIDKFGSEAGYVMQSIGRAQVAFGIYDDNMLTLNLKENRGKWDKIEGDDIDGFFTKRKYSFIRPEGYYWEPFRLATSFLGINDSIDCQFEWVVTFAYTSWMYNIIEDRYVTVFLASETACPNGHKRSEVTKLRLRNDMFQRTDEQIGYYSFRFNGRNGAGNSERLFIWSDGLMAIRKIELIARPVTTARTSPMFTQPDFSAVEEL